MPACRSTASRTGSTSCCAARARRGSRIACRASLQCSGSDMRNINEASYLQESASQTAGPYVHIGLAPNVAGFDIFEKNFSNVLAGAGTQGERIPIEGRVIDGSGTTVRDVLSARWHANATSKYNLPAVVQDTPLH